jgi:transposase
MTREDLIIENTKLNKRLAALETELKWLKEQILLAQKKQFGSSSEKTSALQIELGFNEAEAVADSSDDVVEPKTVTYTRKPKSVGHREEVLQNLPTEVIEYHLPEEERVCSCCGGPMHEMGSDTRDEVVIIPAQVKAIKHINFKYACRNCERNEITTPIITAPAPKALIPKSLASASAVAYIMSQKYTEAMPLYRQEKHFERMGIELPRATLSNWMLKGGEMLEPIFNCMHKKLLNLDIVHADETTLQVLHEVGRKAESKSYMWLYRSGRDGPPIVLFEYQPTRNGNHPKQFLEGFTGHLHADGYAGYNDIKSVILVGCWAHARRKFVDALNVIPQAQRDDPKNLANIALKYISDLYKIEKELCGASYEHRKAVRNERSKEILDEFKTWIDRESGLILPKNILGTAFTYCKNQWPKLIEFLADGRLEIDNNRAERSIKPFVIGRKNWLFSNTPRGAKTSAIIYSIIETVKENGLDPFCYLKYVFEQLQKNNSKKIIDDLLPWNPTVQALLNIKLNTSTS